MISMIDSFNVIYKGAVIKKPAPKPKPRPSTERAIKRQGELLRITTKNPMRVKEISKELGAELAIIRYDIVSLIDRGLLVNLSAHSRSYLVRAA